MNIYRTKYGFAKAKLKLYGKTMRQTARLDLIESKARKVRECDGEWERLIADYLAYGNTEEERKFIAWMFFRDSSVIEVCRKFYISEKSYYVRRERILNDVLFLATERGLITTGISGDGAAATCDEKEISEPKRQEIERLFAEQFEGRVEIGLLTVEAVMYVTSNNLPWRDLPEKYGLWNTVYKRYSRWRKSGLWGRIRKILDD